MRVQIKTCLRLSRGLPWSGSWGNHPTWRRGGQAVPEPVRGPGPYVMVVGLAVVCGQGLRTPFAPLRCLDGACHRPVQIVVTRRSGRGAPDVAGPVGRVGGAAAKAAYTLLSRWTTLAAEQGRVLWHPNVGIVWLSTVTYASLPACRWQGWHDDERSDTRRNLSHDADERGRHLPADASPCSLSNRARLLRRRGSSSRCADPHRVQQADVLAQG